MTNKERFKEIFISQVTRPGAADLLAWLGTTDFFEAPASTRFHGAYPGGLVEHSLNVYYALLGQSTIREYGGESIAVVALLHDVCKTGYYRRERDGKYSVKDQLPMGHGEKSVYLVMKFMDLTDEEALAIRWHMGAYDDAFRGGSRALNEAHPCFPLFPAGQYGALKLRPVRYTADFRLVYADGTVEIVEIKSKFVRRMQRDYALRRRVFLEQVARPAGWKFTEIITADSKEEIDRWTELTKGAK